MAPSQRRYCRLALVALFLASFLDLASALSAEYCSSLNTADTNRNISIYQSNGLCYDFCLADYAFAVLQGEGCWCSNIAPGITTSLSDCDEECPGYPEDLCGGSALYGYIALAKAPSGTSAAQSTTVTVTPTPGAVTVVHTLIDTVSPSTLPASSSSSFSSSSQAASTTTTQSSTSSTWTPTPVLTLETVTGQVRTVTVTPTVPPSSQSDTGVSKKGGSGLGTGPAVGLTVGLVALVALVSSLVYFCIRKRQAQKDIIEEYSSASQRGSSSGLGGPIPSRTMSENSRYVLGTDGRQVVETWEPDAVERRTSRLMPVDPRLNPFAAVYQRGENKSRESFNTIRDDHDYSRRVHQQAPILRATNPDA